jgi:hypothetical protein
MALPKFYKVVQDQQGNIVPQVLGSVFNHGTAVLASLYQDDAGTVPLSNPMTSDAQYGSFKFYVNPGHYDLTFTKPGYTFEPIFDMQVPQDVLTLGTMATQNASAVAITGGTISLLANASPGAYLVNNDAAATAQIGFRSIVSAGTGKYNVLCDGTAQNAFTGPVGCGNATPTYPLDVTGQARVTGTLGVGVAPSASYNLYLSRNKASVHGIVFQPTGSDTATNEVMFLNVAGSIVGTIQSTAAATSYNTSSDKRLKEAITALPDALATIQRLLPVQFRWKTTGEVAQGFLAQDVQPLVPQAVTGDPADPTPNMQMDLSKLVPYLTGACQELAAQVQALTARVADLEAALA